MNKMTNLSVDVICYGERTTFKSREEAIAAYEENILGSEGSERDRYVEIYLQLKNTSKTVVSDGDPEKIKEKPIEKVYKKEDKWTIIGKILSGEITINSKCIAEDCLTDRDILSAFLKMQGWYAAQYLRKYVCDDQGLLRIAALSGYDSLGILSYGSEKVRDNKLFVLEMIGYSARNFRHASERLHNDPEVVSAALHCAKNKQELKDVISSVGPTLLKSTFASYILHEPLNCDHLLKMAKDVAYMAHIGQVDKGGQPYFGHPEAVAELIPFKRLKIIAYLHDVCEDSNITCDDLRSYGFPEDIVDAVFAMTKQKGESYEGYLTRVKENELARHVKIADLEHNMDISRIPNPTDKDLKRVEKYKKALDFLKDK